MKNISHKDQLDSAQSCPINSQVRLNKALADAGVCSRRKADEYIRQGLVRVNNLVVTDLAVRVNPRTDSIAVNGKPLGKTEQAPCCLMLHKPVQVLSTVYDPEGRHTVMDFIPEEFHSRRLYPVGRLDFFSEGLLLLSDDGELTHRLTHPRHHLPKVYHVLLREEPSQKMLQAIQQGMNLEDGTPLAPMQVELFSNPRGVLMELTLHQGINRQIRRMCALFKLTILRLSRIAQGPLELGDLESGKARILTPEEYANLRKAVGLE